MCVVIQLRVTNAIKAWIVNHWSDFNDKLLASLKAFIDGTLRIENKNLAEILVTQLNAKVFLFVSFPILFYPFFIIFLFYFSFVCFFVCIC